MKKTFWSLMILGAVAFGFTACGEKENPIERPTPQEQKDPENHSQDPKPGQDPVDPGTQAECDWADFLVEASFTADPTTDYGVGELNWATMTTKGGKTIPEALGFDSYEALATALGDNALEGDVQLFGNDPVTGYDITEAFNTNAVGYWCNGQGGLSSWGDDASRIYTECFFDEETGLLSEIATIGVRPDHITAGDTYVVRMVWQKTEGESVKRVGVEGKITIEAFVDPEADMYDASKRQAGSFEMQVDVEVPLNAFYDGVYEDLSEMQKYLQLTKFQITEIAGKCDIDDETGEVLRGFNVANIVGGEVVPSNAGGIGGNWLDGEGGVGAWGVETGAYFVEMIAASDFLGVHVGTMPGEEDGITDLVAGLEGKTMNYQQVVTYIPEFGADPTVINVFYNIKFVAAE